MYDIPRNVPYDVRYNGMGCHTIRSGISHRISLPKAAETWATDVTRYAMEMLGHPIGYPMYTIWDIL